MLFDGLRLLSKKAGDFFYDLWYLCLGKKLRVRCTLNLKTSFMTAEIPGLTRGRVVGVVSQCWGAPPQC